MTRLLPFGALALTVALGACAQVQDAFSRGDTVPGAAAESPPAANSDLPREVAAVVAAPPPPAAARTAEDFDTTTDAQKAAAQARPESDGARLGEVAAALGDPAEAGLWIKTKLVTSPRPGRIENTATGSSALVELRPLDGQGGATLSLAAMRLLEVPLTDIPTVAVFGR